MKIFLYLSSFIFLISGCKKETTSAKALGSITIINALSDNAVIEPNFSDSIILFSINKAQLSNGSSIEYGQPAGIFPLNIVSSDDTLNAIFQQKINCEGGRLYSLFLSNVGKPKQVDYVITADTVPSYADSSAGVRFINLSPENLFLSVNLAGNSISQKEFDDLGYKNISGFKAYSVKSSIGGMYNFEIRNRLNDSLIANYQWNFTFQKCNTIVISGFESSGIYVFQVNNF